ncbi:MAG: Periplasmic binding protein-like domain, partial [Gaiellaceae bacterium]|nr:Periplasmic binding protein-like domain [Gaiellaceae bacterium]
VLGRLGELSIRVPNDLSLVVYGYLVPPMREHLGLPTIAYPVEDVAAATRQLLLRRLDQPEAAPRSSSVPTIFIDTHDGT